MITVAKLEEAAVLHTAVGVAHDTLQTSKEERLTHHVEVGAKRIDDANECLLRVSVQFLIVSLFRERVVENLIEARTDKLLRYEVLELMALVFKTLRYER